LAAPRLASDAVPVSIVLPIVPRLAPVGGGEANHTRRSAIRRCCGVPQGDVQRPPREVLKNRIEESRYGERSERRDAGLVPMTGAAKPWASAAIC
jgi:hypothetical protein